MEHSTLKKILKHQIKNQQAMFKPKASTAAQKRSKVGKLAHEGDQLDHTLAMTDSIIEMGSTSAASIQGQSETLKSTRKKIQYIQNQSLVSINQVMGLIGRAKLRNKLILAFVIAICLAVLFWGRLGSSGVPAPSLTNDSK